MSLEKKKGMFLKHHGLLGFKGKKIQVKKQEDIY